MKDKTLKRIKDANEATAAVAYRLSELIAIYPITPSSPMAEFCDEWSAKDQKNIWNVTPEVTELQAEGGVAGAVHGILQGSALSTTFTASQGLLLMLPNMYKIAGELLPFCMHVSARSVASHALSIFGDHSDVMACRQSGFAMLASNSVQEAHDFACIAHAATLKSSLPFLHFFDGFRTSHEINTYSHISDDILKEMMDEEALFAFRKRALTPDNPLLRGTAQNPDVFFQCREAANTYYDATPGIVQALFDQFAKLTGRQYKLFEYVGAPDAENVVIIMGSGAETVDETSKWLNNNGEKTGVLKVRLYRPFSAKDCVAALPNSVKNIAVLDRTKESGSMGEPLYQDVVTALREENKDIRVIGGRYGLGSKEFAPNAAKAVFDELKKDSPKNHFTVGIIDDVTHTSLDYDPAFSLKDEKLFRAIFFGLGADGTVGANKNTIKIIGEETDNYAQAYFVYDSKKSGAMTVSHLRFGPEPIHAPYLIRNAAFLGCHQPQFLGKYDVLASLAEGGIFLLNSPHLVDDVWSTLPKTAQERLIEKKAKFYTIDAYKVAKETEMGSRINTIMQTCFFAISGILPRDEAIQKIKDAIQKTYGKKGEQVVQKNFAAVDATLANLHEVTIPSSASATHDIDASIDESAPEFVQKTTAAIMAHRGDDLPVSAFPVDGTWPTGTTKFEKRNIAQEIPEWDPEICIQCNRCALICPHAAIRSKFYPESECSAKPDGFKCTDFKSRDVKDHKMTIQVAPEDCTGCGLCVTMCPAKDKSNPKHKAINMVAKEPILEQEKTNFEFFERIPYPEKSSLPIDVKSSQFREPLFEFSGACAGCGETPYIKLLSQLYGDRLVIANATGCSSIYGGNLPTTPFSKDKNGRGPAWANSLFEDNAEFGLGMRLAIDKKTSMAKDLLKSCASKLGDDLVTSILDAPQESDSDIEQQRNRVATLKDKLTSTSTSEEKWLLDLADYLVEKVVWIIGGDGWAYDIGYGGLDHVLASQKNVNVLVLDTEVYSNTGGQQSKATPMAAVAKFAAAGKPTPKKDLGMLAVSYGNIYVAQIAMGANYPQTVKAFAEATSYSHSSLVIAYSHCIAHGYNFNFGMDQQKKAVECGHWPLYRFDPRKEDKAFKLDSGEPKIPLREYIENEGRYRMLQISNPDRAKQLEESAQKEIHKRFAFYQQIANMENN